MALRGSEGDLLVNVVANAQVGFSVQLAASALQLHRSIPEILGTAISADLQLNRLVYSGKRK